MKLRNFNQMATAFCCAVSLIAQQVPACHLSGVSMPSVVTIAGTQLHLNGMGMRKVKGLVNAYVIGLYLENPTADAQAAISTAEHKRIVIHMLRDASHAQFVHELERGLTRNAGAEMPALRARLDRLEHALPALKKGNVLSITYVPGTGTTMRAQGKEMTIRGKDFAAALLSIWLGPKPISASLKPQLLSDGNGCANTLMSKGAPDGNQPSGASVVSAAQRAPHL
jgi:hypothetical protein